LLLRQDNAPERLLQHARNLGTLTRDEQQRLEDRIGSREEAVRRARALGPLPADAGEWIGRPELAGLGTEAIESALIEIRYEGYIERQRRAVARAERNEDLALSDALTSRQLHGISREGHEKIQRFRPATVGQASRIPGFSPADVAVLIIHAERERRLESSTASS